MYCANLTLILSLDRRRKSCCHPFIAGDVFKFMSILIKLSNHLGLILPGEKLQPLSFLGILTKLFKGPNDTPDQV